MNIRKQATNSLFWSFLGKWGSQVFSLIIVAILSRLLLPEDFGLIALATVFTLLAQILTDQGFGDAIVQRSELETAHLNTAFWVNVSFGIAMALMIISASGLIATFYQEPRLAPVLHWLSLGFAIGGFSSTQLATLRRRLAFKEMTIRSLIAVVSGGIAGIIAALMGYGVWSLVAQILVKTSVDVIVLWQVSEWRPTFNFSRRHFWELFQFGGNSTGTKLLEFANSHTDKLLIGYYLGPVELGYYTIAYKLVPMMIRLLIGVTNAVAFPMFSRLQNSPKQMTSAFNSITYWTCLIAIPAFLSISVLAPEIVPVMFGPNWDPSIPVMEILAFIGILKLVLTFNSSIIRSMGKPAWDLGITFIYSIVTVSAFFMVVERGIIVIATVYVLLSYLIAPLSLYLVKKLIQMDITSYLKQFLIPVGGAVFMNMAILIFKYLLADYLPLEARLIILIVAGFLSYLLFLKIFAPSVLSEVNLMARKSISGFRNKTAKTPSPVNATPAKKISQLSAPRPVSVIMTVFNGEEYLSQAIDSILNQSFKNFEFIIVDDGSSDKTPEILRKAMTDDRIHVITCNRIGRAAALNVAWRNARGKYIANIDADDLAEPERLEKQFDYFQKNPSLGMLGTRCKVLDESTGKSTLTRPLFNNQELHEIMVRINPFIHSSVMMPRVILEEMNGYNETFTVGIDYELWVRIADKYDIASLKDILTIRRLDGSNFFLHKISSWERCKNKIKTRWYVWRRSSHSFKELYYVIFQPIAKYINAQSRGRFTNSKLIQFMRAK